MEFKFCTGSLKGFEYRTKTIRWTVEYNRAEYTLKSGDYVKLLYSCGFNCCEGDNHIFPGMNNVNVLSPWSDNRLCEPGNYWVPNTKPSQNCGLEIISQVRDYFIIDFYEKDPWLSSPSYPKNITLLPDTCVKLSWDQNCEPDFMYYKIYKKNGAEFKFYETCFNNEFEDILEKPDTSFTSGRFLLYKLSAVDSSNKESAFSAEIKVQVIRNVSHLKITKTDNYNRPVLNSNYPNPFNSSTKISYIIPVQCNVVLEVFDGLGRETAVLVNEEQPAGRYNVEFDGTEFSSGIYFCRLSVYPASSGAYTVSEGVEEYIETKKMLLIK